jgi:WD40 repeat protein
LISGDTLLAGTSGGEVCLFSVYSKIYRATMSISSNGLLSIALIDDFIFVGGGDGKVKKLNIASGKWSLTHEAQLDSKVMSIAVSPDKKELIVGTSGGKMYRVLTADLSFMLHTDAHTGCLNDIVFGTDRSDRFLCIDENGAVKMWDLSEYKSIFTAYGGTGKGARGSSCAIAQDDFSIVTGWRDGFIRAYDPSSSRVLWEIANAHRGSVTCLYVDANYILSGGEDGAVRVWARTTRKLLIQFNGNY